LIYYTNIFILYFLKKINKKIYYLYIILGIGDWGLGIGDWGLGPIPNPQSPLHIKFIIFIIIKNIKNINY